MTDFTGVATGMLGSSSEDAFSVGLVEYVYVVRHPTHAHRAIPVDSHLSQPPGV